MMYQNTIGRATLYQHDVQGEGLDHCYDCTSELLTIRSYLLAAGLVMNEQIIAEWSKWISGEITAKTSHRTLATDSYKSLTDRPEEAKFKPRQSHTNGGKEFHQLVS